MGNKRNETIQLWSSRAHALSGKSDNITGKGWDCMDTGSRGHGGREGKARTSTGDKKARQEGEEPESGRSLRRWWGMSTQTGGPSSRSCVVLTV